MISTVCLLSMIVLFYITNCNMMIGNHYSFFVVDAKWMNRSSSTNYIAFIIRNKRIEFSSIRFSSATSTGTTACDQGISFKKSRSRLLSLQSCSTKSSCCSTLNWTATTTTTTTRATTTTANNDDILIQQQWKKRRRRQQYENANNVMNILARNNRSWQRLRPIIELALLTTTTTNNNNTTTDTIFCNTNDHDADDNNFIVQQSFITKPNIVDIGTDHGLLAFGLAATNHFHKVVGIDVSLDALQNGAYQLWKSIQYKQQQQQQNIEEATTTNNSDQLIKFMQTDQLEFRHGNGLLGLKKDETVDIICIAGMGTTTMMNILFPEQQQQQQQRHDHDNNDKQIEHDSHSTTPKQPQQQQQHTAASLLLHHLNCTNIILQTTNSKPKHLMVLYQTLYNSGYMIDDERIEYVGNRWYLTSSFAVRSSTCRSSSTIHNNNNHNNNFDEEGRRRLSPSLMNQHSQHYQKHDENNENDNDDSFLVPGSMLAKRKYESTWLLLLFNNSNKNSNDYDGVNDNDDYSALVQSTWDNFQNWLIHHKQWMYTNIKQTKKSNHNDVIESDLSKGISVQEQQWLAAHKHTISTSNNNNIKS